MRIPFELPAGWPWSIWFFIITLVVYLLQRFPLTGVFLMIVGAAFWSVLLINLGMFGIVAEAVTGRVSALWLAIPLLYFGGYYAAYENDQRMLAKVRQETASFNAGKRLPFDPRRQDLVIETRGGGVGLSPSEFVESFGLSQAFDSEGRVWLVATEEVCTLINSDRGFLTAGIQAHMITRPGKRRFSTVGTGHCMVMMPGKPDKPVMRVTRAEEEEMRGGLAVRLTTMVAEDSASGKKAAVRSGLASPLKRFPMWIMGCALDSGTPAWRCFHGFMRTTYTQLLPAVPRYSSGAPVVASLLGLHPSDDLASRAIGTERFQPIADRIDAEKVAKEIAILEQMLSAPTEHVKDGWLHHLPNRPAVVAPYAARIFAALEKLQASDRTASDTGKNLWTLIEKMSEETLAPHRPRMVALMRTSVARPWTRDSYMAYSRLDVADRVQRDIVLDRLTLERRNFPAELLPPFCRMGANAPEDVKQRLLALWQARVPDKTNKGWGTQRDRIDVVLYLTLARMGLKQQAGKVEQQYYGPTFLDIWQHIAPASPDEVCVGNPHEIETYFRKAGIRR